MKCLPQLEWACGQLFERNKGNREALTGRYPPWNTRMALNNASFLSSASWLIKNGACCVHTSVYNKNYFTIVHTVFIIGQMFRCTKDGGVLNFNIGKSWYKVNLNLIWLQWFPVLFMAQISPFWICRFILSKIIFPLDLFLSPLSVATGANLLTDIIHLIEIKSFNTFKGKKKNLSDNLPQVTLCVRCHMLAAVRRLRQLLCDGNATCLRVLSCAKEPETHHTQTLMCVPARWSLLQALTEE